jgi:hypothetical protein
MTGKLMLGVFSLAVIVMVIMAAPDIKRYVKMSAM